MPRHGHTRIPRPSGLKCPSCGSTKIISQGYRWKCMNCNRKWVKSYSPLLNKVCPCPCGLTFSPKTFNQIFLDRHHRELYYRLHYQKTLHFYHGFFKCPICGDYGGLYELKGSWKGKPNYRSSFCIVHFKNRKVSKRCVLR